MASLKTTAPCHLPLTSLLAISHGVSMSTLLSLGLRLRHSRSTTCLEFRYLTPFSFREKMPQRGPWLLTSFIITASIWQNFSSVRYCRLLTTAGSQRALLLFSSLTMARWQGHMGE